MGVFLMLTFVGVLLFGFYAIAASQYGMIDGLGVVFLAIAIPVLLPFIIAFFTTGKKPKQTEKYISKNEYVMNTFEEVKQKLNYGKYVRFDDKIFLFNLTEANRMLDTSVLHCFDYSGFCKDYAYKKIYFSKICGCEVFENGNIINSVYGNDFKCNSNTTCKNGIVLYDNSGFTPDGFTVFEFCGDANELFLMVEFIVNNKKLWNYKTKWETIEQLGIFNNISNVF